MINLSQDEINDFCDKLKNFGESLEGDQRKLFDAICEVAWEVAAEENEIESGFEGCFTPDQADLIVRYAAGEVEMVTGKAKNAAMIKGSAHMIRWTVNP